MNETEKVYAVNLFLKRDTKQCVLCYHIVYSHNSNFTCTAHSFEKVANDDDDNGDVGKIIKHSFEFVR